ncbi:YozE family protein [Lysinibacillus antri]|uniref:YozE family protein n=1 Tax=Lysinibacillus antri TaxID=2498145 RepID=A0A432LDS6_9BACI|nr:YozE family protein [Lysinibacillus antri]RUL54007.1 YozE family protein [Lysinibacillus antri]
MKTSFYLFVLTFRGGDWEDRKTRFAEGAFLDHSFPKTSTSFDELSSYIETLVHEHMTTQAFDELWSLYEMKNE